MSLSHTGNMQKTEWLYMYDPKNPVISVGGETLFSSNSRKGSILQQPVGYRDDKLGSRQTYTPGEIVEVTVEVLPIIWEIKKGSRIRIDISSSDFPQYSIHSNYPGVWSQQTKTRTANQTVHTGKKYPTRIIIPIL